MKKNTQRTLKRSVSFRGMALHSGCLVEVEIRPAAANTGIVFQRVDLPQKPYIKASPENVFDTRLATRIGTPAVCVSTVEHLMAAFFGFGIDNAIVALNHAEMPVLDGSAAPFLVLLDEVGICEQNVARKILVIKEAIDIVDERDKTRFIRIEPSKKPLISYVIDYPQIGKQTISLDYTSFAFCENFAYARTFCLEQEIDYMRSQGLAKGGSLENAIVVSKNGLLNLKGLRSELEFVKHKVLDCIGDLKLLGAPILGHVIASKAGHDLHTKLAAAIQQQKLAGKVFVPSASETKSPTYKDVLISPKSLSEIDQRLIGLATG